MATLLSVIAVVVTASVGMYLVVPRVTAMEWPIEKRMVFVMRMMLWGASPPAALALLLGPSQVRHETALAAALLGVGVAFAFPWFRYRTGRFVVRRLDALRDPDTRRQVWEQLAALLDRTRPRKRDSAWVIGAWMTAVERLAGTLLDVGEYDMAADALAKLAPMARRENSAAAALEHAMWALVHVHRGRIGAADAALAAVKRPCPCVSVEATLLAAEALVRAMDAQPAQALRILDHWTLPDGYEQCTRLEARAHALAALGDLGGARRALYDIERCFGPDALLRVSCTTGAASELARMLSHEEVPYRSAGG